MRYQIGLFFLETRFFLAKFLLFFKLVFEFNFLDESNVDEIFTSLVDYLITEALKFLDSLHFVSPGLAMMLESIGKLFALTWLR